MRMTFSTPVTPTRERLTVVAGRRPWTSLPRRAIRSVMAKPNVSGAFGANRTNRCTLAAARRYGLSGPTGSAPRGAPATHNSTAQLPATIGDLAVSKERGIDEARGSCTADRAERDTAPRDRGGARAGIRGPRARLPHLRGDLHGVRGGRAHQGTGRGVPRAPAGERGGDRRERGPTQRADRDRRRRCPARAEEAS